MRFISLSSLDPWFLEKIREFVITDSEIEKFRGNLGAIDAALAADLEANGFCRRAHR